MGASLTQQRFNEESSVFPKNQWLLRWFLQPVCDFSILGLFQGAILGLRFSDRASLNTRDKWEEKTPWKL